MPPSQPDGNSAVVHTVTFSEDVVDLIVQPDDGLQPVLDTVKRAQDHLDLVIFRFDLRPLEKAIETAVERGVAVRALIAHTNSGGEKRLRELELRMLEAGVTVSRTADDLVRYHGKMLIVDRAEVHVYGFNFTALDLKSRSFGVTCRHRNSVQEGLRLFEADAMRQDFEPRRDTFVVSPENARERLAAFVKRAQKELAIYDPKLTDPQMIRLLRQRASAGVDVRIIGKVGLQAGDLQVQKLPGRRLHVRAIVRDGRAAFVGSQSMRTVELDARREVGLITKDAKVVKRLLDVFESDWAKTDLGEKETKKAAALSDQNEAAAH
jgi:phosphatidylserine/phosphatidylglycerophosphate/cardiolipin synthase-like enzyme